MPYLEVWRDKDKRRYSWRWHRKAGNQEIVATSGEGYTRKWNAKRAAHKAFPDDEIRVEP